MHVFSIKDMENLSGIKAHTLRVWEKRYGILSPDRKDSSHRVYNNEELKLLLRVALLYNKGFKIGHIARMDTVEMSRATISEMGSVHYYESLINQLVEASIDYDTILFEKVLTNMVMHIGFEKCVNQLIYPFLEKIGLLWMTNNVIPAQEHFASNIIRAKFLTAIDGLGNNNLDADKEILLFSPEGELHEIPLLMAKYKLKKKQLKVVYLGCNTPIDDVLYYCKHKTPTHIYMHLITQLAEPSIENYIGELIQNIPKIDMVVCGPKVSQLAIRNERLQLLSQSDDMLAYINSL
jgi:MerR family transcriptional regulator, light-induced transcriptional regulator